MGDILTTLDLVVFFAALIGAMVVGLIAGRKEETASDYFLAGKTLPWWGVAGSIFGSNVSANHMVGMLGIGFSVGFAQSHFELGAIAGLMLLCYGFLPVYRRLNVYTLSEYLEYRYDGRSRVAYSLIMLIIMAVLHMTPGLYIGSRSICILVGEPAVEQVTVPSQTNADGEVVAEKTKFDVNKSYYTTFVIGLAIIAASYTIVGGLKAVVWTDVVQSVLMLLAGIGVALLTFSEIGGWSAMLEMDRAVDGADKMHLYLPMNDPDLPWTGVFTGLMAMHFFYWGTNQFIAQRALGARSDREARLGIVAAGFLKLLIPFFAIGTGVAAVYLFREKFPDVNIAPDTAFPELVKLVVKPFGWGLIGLISAGLIGAILSSIDSMMNSAATLITFDVYKRYINPNATDRQMIRIGRASILVLVTLATGLALFVLDPNSEENFFLKIADYQNFLTPGLLVAFFMGIFWKRGTAMAAIVTILGGIFFSWLTVFAYDNWLVHFPVVTEAFGPSLNFFHRVVVVIGLCTITHVAVSLCTPRDIEKERYIWSGGGTHGQNDLRNLASAIGLSLVVFAVMAACMVYEMASPTTCAVLGALWTLAMFWGTVLRHPAAPESPDAKAPGFIADDRTWAGVLCSLAVFMMYYFY